MSEAGEFNRKWRRYLPIGEWVFDGEFTDKARWLLAEKLGFGEGSSIYPSAHVYSHENISVGKNTWIGPYVILDGSGGRLKIGDNCSISAGVQIYTHDSVKWAVSGGKKPYSKASVKIGNNCYLAPYVVVGKGSVIPDGSIIPAHTLVTRRNAGGFKRV